MTKKSNNNTPATPSVSAESSSSIESATSILLISQPNQNSIPSRQNISKPSKPKVVEDFIQKINEILKEAEEGSLEKLIEKINALITQFEASTNNKINTYGDELFKTILNFILYGTACSIFLRDPSKQASKQIPRSILKNRCQ